MKKIFIALILTASLSAMSCGSGGAGNANVPSGENPGTASVLRLLAAQYIAQVNASIYLRALVLDGNGKPVPNKTVTFSNLSTIGTLSSASAASGTRSSTGLAAVTDSNGIASARIDSNTSGFVTLQAETDSGASVIINKLTVYFSTYPLTYPASETSGSTLRLDIDSNGNGVYNETDDYLLFKTAGNEQALVRATVLDGSNSPVTNTTVTFGSDSSSASFPMGSTKNTDKNGQATALVTVSPSVLTTFTTTLNITASAANGAANMTTIFLNPVIIDTSLSHASATPDIANTNATTTINAVLILNTGSPAPDNTTVNFAATCGSVTPFAQTTAGAATATFTAPANPGTCLVTATAGGITIGTVDITATTALAVSPAAQTITGTSYAIGTAQFTITGGAPPYQITASDGTTIQSVTSSGGTFKVNVNTTRSTSVTYTIVDAAGSKVTATLTVTVTPSTPVATLVVNPSAVTTVILGTMPTTVNFSVSGGTSPYTAISSDFTKAFNDNGAGGGTANDGINNGAEGGTWTGSAFTATISGASGDTVNITVTDSTGQSKTVTIMIQ